MIMHIHGLQFHSITSDFDGIRHLVSPLMSFGGGHLFISHAAVFTSPPFSGGRFSNFRIFHHFSEIVACKLQATIESCLKFSEFESSIVHTFEASIVHTLVKFCMMLK